MIGSRVGPYEIRRELGSGGMGTVYLAEGDGRQVALKVVHPHLIATPGFFKRFLREAEVGRKVEHPNVVRTLDIDLAEASDGRHVHYIVMEYVEGKNLRELLRELGTIPETLLREIALQTADGLAAIHAGGIVHRDLKPENILITNDHVVRIMDLGVAKLQEASVAITMGGQFAGSLLYAAPEQFRHEDVGPAADLYSLGVLLYELATGQIPFRASDAASIIHAHLNEDLPRAHDRSQSVSPFLSEVIATLLSKQPSTRFASASALGEVLREAEGSEWWTEHEPVQPAHLPNVRVNRETALYGRGQDLAALKDAWARAQEGRGNTIWIEGEAGIGKTRLVDAFLREVGDAHVLYGSYPPSGGLGGFSDAILDRFGSARLGESLRPYLTETPTLVPAFAALVKHEAPPAGTEPLEGDALQAVAVYLVRALAREKPTIWVVDDLHFAPQGSRDVVLALARAVEGHRILLVVTARLGLALEDFSRLDNFEKRTLARLGGRDIVRLLADAFRSDDLAERLAGRIAVKSDGVPFFVFEMIRGLKQGNFIKQRQDGTYVQTQVVSDIEVPSAVKDLIEARMRGLSREERAILDVGAVCGMSFDPGLVAAVLEEKRVRVLRDLAEIERRHGLVRGEAGRTRFDQNQIQEVLYQGVPPDLRAEYHTLLAEAHEGDDPVFLAHHHLRGSRPKEALPHLEAALERLEKSYRNDALLDLASRALASKGLLAGKERVEVLLKKAGRLDLLGRRDEERATLEEAAAVADGTGDPALRGKARRSLGALWWALSEYEAVQTALREALELARAAGDRKLEAQATGNLGNVLRDLGRYAEAREHQERSIALFREIGDPEGESAATNNLGIVFRRLGRHAEAREHFERACALSREIGDRLGEATATGNLGVVLAAAGQHAEVREHFERACALSRQIGYRLGEAGATGNLGMVFLAVGQHAEARKHFERHRALSREIGDRRGEAVATGNLGILFSRLGQHAAAREHLERSGAIAREIGSRSIEVSALRGLAAHAEVAGDVDGAARLRAEALALARELKETDTVAEIQVELARAEAARGDAGSAALHLDEALGLARETGNPRTILVATVERARLPGGDVDAALAALREHEERTQHVWRMEARFRLWQLTNDPVHLDEAKRLLDFMVDHAPEEDRDGMIRNVPLHREITEARRER